MKLLKFLLIFLLSLPVIVTAQNTFPNTISGNTSARTMIINKGAATFERGVVFGYFADTTAANAVSYVRLTKRIVIATAGGKLWMRNDYATGWILVNGSGGGAGITDGDKWDITVTGAGTVWEIDNDVITYSKLNSDVVTNLNGLYKAIGYNPGLSTILANGNTQSKGDTIFSHSPSQNGLWYKAYRPVSEPYISRSLTGYGFNVYNRSNAYTLIQDGQIQMKNPVPYIEMHDSTGVLRMSLGWDPVYKHSFHDRHGSTDHTEEYDGNNPYVYIVGPSSNLFPSKYWGCIAWAGMPSYNIIIGNGLFGDPSAASDKDSKLTVYGNLKVKGDTLKLDGSKIFANSLPSGKQSKQVYWNPADSLFYVGDSTGTGGAGGGANITLNNLGITDINTALFAQSGVALGNFSKPFQNLYLYGSGTYGSAAVKIDVAAVSNSTFTIPNYDATAATLAGTETLTNKSFPNQSANDSSSKPANTAYADRAAKTAAAQAVHDSSQKVYSNRGNKITMTADADSVAINAFVHVATTTSASTITPNSDTTDMYTVTALATNPTFAAPTGTPHDGQPLLIRIKDDGTSRTLTWNSAYRAGTDFTLPTATTISKTMYVQFVYNTADSKWDAVGLTKGF